MRFALVGLSWVLLASPVLADVCEEIDITCSLNDLGNNEYEFVFTVENGSSEPNAIWFWVVESPEVPASWETINFVLPVGWVANHPGSQLHFSATSNGSGDPYRLYSPLAATCGTSTYEFRWTFFNNGGPMPDCAAFDAFDYTFHMQNVDEMSCVNIGDSFVCPGAVPVENSTWGMIKQQYHYE